MSALLMGRVFYAELTAQMKLTLLALVDHADDDGGRIFVGQVRLAQKVGCSERTIRRAVEALTAAGYLVPEGRHGSRGTNHYRVDLAKLPHGRPDTIVADRPDWPTGQIEPISAPRPAKSVPRPDTAVSAEPSVRTISKKQPPVFTVAAEVLAYVNELGGKRFPPVAANLDRIAARLREYDEYTLAAMLRRKWADWRIPDRGGTDMRKFFRPKTLFAAENCAQYVGELTDLDLAWVAKQQAKQVAS